MNPVVTPVDDQHVVVHLTAQDRKALKKINLTEGDTEATGIAMHKMCVMQAVTALTTPGLDLEALIKEWDQVNEVLNNSVVGEEEYSRAYDRQGKLHDELSLHYNPICVSEAITDIMVHLNDSCDDRQRAQLKRLIADEIILNTCPVKRKVKIYKTKPDVVEEKRDPTPEYRAAERERRTMLAPIHDGVYNERTGEKDQLSFPKKLQLIREAAAMFKVTACS